ncbi:hypothetical protein GY12_20285 [Micrococcus luteus]|nr:hypothetical protein GY12_20285 [Micrococcus luteus]
MLSGVWRDGEVCEGVDVRRSVLGEFDNVCPRFIPQCFEVALMRLMAAVRCVGRGVWLAHGEGQGVRGGVSVLVWMSMRRERMRRAVAFVHPREVVECPCDVGVWCDGVCIATVVPFCL